MKLLKLILILILGNVALIFGQVSGVVLDQASQLPLTGANVYLKNLKIGTVTDNDGFFYIMLPRQADVESDSLIISFLGYEDYRQAYSRFPNKSTIELMPQNLTLDQAIQVFAERLDLARQEIPHMKEEIRAEELARYGASEISDLFKKMPSVRIEGNDLDGRHIQIRGSNASEVNVYLDGILINGISFDNAADLTLIPTESIHKVEVLKGANLPLLGSGAFGGVLNIISKKEVQPRAMIKTKLGSFESKYLTGYLNLPLRKNLYVNYFGQYNEMRPDIEYFQGERFAEKTKNSRINSDKQNHNVNIDYFMDIGQISAKFYSYWFDYDKPFYSSSRENLLFALLFNGQNDLNFTLSQSFSTDDVSRYLVKTTRYLSTYESQRLNFKASKKFTFNRTSIQFLGEYLHDELDDWSKVRDASGMRTYYKASLYDNRAGIASVFSFEDQRDTLGTLNWKTFIGLRGDFTGSGNRDFTNTIGLQVNWRWNNWLIKPYINYGKNVKYPSLLESTYVQDLLIYTSQDTTTSLLKPEYNQSFDLGTQMSYSFFSDYARNLNMSFSYFRNIIYNKILKRPLGDLIIQSQLGRNTTSGLEATFQLESVLRYLNVSAAATWLNIDNPLLYEYKPEQNYNFQIDFISQFGFYLSAIYFYEGRSYAWYFDVENQLRTERIAGHYDMDISLGYAFDISGLEINAQLSGYNVFDNSGFKYYYLKKQYLQASLSLKY